MFAAVEGHVDGLRLLIAAEADPAAKERNEDDASMIATACGHPGLASLIEGFSLSPQRGDRAGVGYGRGAGVARPAGFARLTIHGVCVRAV